jgi:predicted transglutaminase-like cysteine proteinase
LGLSAALYGAPLRLPPPPLEFDEKVGELAPVENPPAGEQGRSLRERGPSREIPPPPAPPAPEDARLVDRPVAFPDAPAPLPPVTPLPAAQEAPAPQVPPGAKPLRLFGTVEFRSDLKNFPKWERVLGYERQTPTFAPGGGMPDVVRRRWEKLAADLRDRPVMEKVQKVNNFFNQWPYKTDSAVWGVEDYWAIPPEFMQKSGDCEDYAITKYYALRSLGIPAADLRIIVVRDTIRNLAHAVLVFINGDSAYILDNLTNLVLSHQKMTHYAPQFSVNEEFLWRHIKPLNKQAAK